MLLDLSSAVREVIYIAEIIQGVPLLKQHAMKTNSGALVLQEAL